MSRIGCASLGDGLPNAERLEQPPRRRDDGGSALVVGMALAERRVGDRDGKRRAKPLAQRDRKRQAGKAAAGNQHIDIGHPGVIATRNPVQRTPGRSGQHTIGRGEGA